MVASFAHRLGSDMPAIGCKPELFEPGRPPLLAVRLPGTTGLASYLAGCIDCRPAVNMYRRHLEMIPPGAEPAYTSGLMILFCPSYDVFDSGKPGTKPSLLPLTNHADTQLHPETLKVTAIHPSPKPAWITSPDGKGFFWFLFIFRRQTPTSRMATRESRPWGP